MGWVKENLCKPKEDVRGLIICKNKDEKLEYAIKMVGDIINIQLYTIDFKLHSAND